MEDMNERCRNKERHSVRQWDTIQKTKVFLHYSIVINIFDAKLLQMILTWLHVLALVEVSVMKRDDLIVTNDDNFITGFLREYVHSIQINQLGDGLTASLWNYVFSTCPFLRKVVTEILWISKKNLFFHYKSSNVTNLWHLIVKNI